MKVSHVEGASRGGLSRGTAPRSRLTGEARSSCLDTPALKSHRCSEDDGSRSPSTVEGAAVIDRRSNAFFKARSDRADLLCRLNDEDESHLAEKLGRCGEPFVLNCTSCGHVHRTEKACNLKWCPVCARRKSAQKVAKYEAAAKRMKWPLGVTLTVANVGAIDADDIRRLKKDIVRLRRTPLFRRQVKGGLVSIELVNTGKGWHPHGHLLIDCEWLSLTTKPPAPQLSRDAKKKRFKAASQELHDVWCKIIGQLMASIHVRRAEVTTMLVESLKYCVKPADLIDCKEPIGPAIRAISGGRLSTPFGNIWGCRKELKEEKRPLPCPCCHATGTMMPEEMVDAIVRSTKKVRR